MGGIGSLGQWLPTHLAGAFSALPAGDALPSDHMRSVGVSVGAAALLLSTSGQLAVRREL